MKKDHLAQLPLFLFVILGLTSLFRTTVHAQSAITPTLYCLAAGCPTLVMTETPSTSISSPVSRIGIRACDPSSPSSPEQQRRGGFLSRIFEFFFIVIELLLKLGEDSLACIPSAVTPTVTQIISPQVTEIQTSGSQTPNNILTLTNWNLQLPIGAPTIISAAQLTGGYQDQYFHTDTSNTGVILHAPVQGTTTTNSDHTRSELRETAANGTLPWGWDAGVGTHTMTAKESITHLPGGPGKSGRLSFAQIHGPDATWYIILEADDNNNGTATLKVHDATNKVNGTIIDPKYVLNTKFDITMSVVNGIVTISYNGTQKVSTTSTQANCYFKIGAYNQSAGDFGEVEISSLAVTHN